MTFAGFWVDGAVRKPEQRHCDMDDTVITKWKREDDAPTEFDICRRSFSGWDKVYWLDMTPRESLTPEELFSVVRVIWPKCEKVFNPGSDASVEWQVQLDDTNEHTPIAWGNLTQYPPPVETQWVVVTRENVGQHLFRECRFKVIPDKADTYWKTGRVVGWCIRENCCLVDSDFNDEEPVMVWAIVEVQA